VAQPDPGELLLRVRDKVLHTLDRLPRSGTLKSRPMELGPLNAIGRNQWSAYFPGVGDDYVIKSGLTSSWLTVAR
jgi:hypothetical protein